MNDEQYLLASAYVDGELTDDERRIAENDPDVMSEVEEIHALRVELSVVEPPTDRAREAAITAAMDEFALQAGPTTRAVPHRPRPAYSRFLGIAAAVVAVGVLGVVVVNSGLGGGDDDDAASTPAAERTLDEATAESADSDADRVEAEVADGALEAAEPQDDVAADEGLGDSAEEMSESTAMTEAAPAVGGEATAESTSDAVDEEVYTADDPGPRPSVELGQPVTTPAELGSLGTLLYERELRDEPLTTPNTKCDASFNVLGESELVEVDRLTPIFVAVQVDEGRVVALDQSTCDELLEGPLYEPEPAP